MAQIDISLFIGKSFQVSRHLNWPESFLCVSFYTVASFCAKVKFGLTILPAYLTHGKSLCVHLSLSPSTKGYSNSFHLSRQRYKWNIWNLECEIERKRERERERERETLSAMLFLVLLVLLLLLLCWVVRFFLCPVSCWRNKKHDTHRGRKTGHTVHSEHR